MYGFVDESTMPRTQLALPRCFVDESTMPRTQLALPRCLATLSLLSQELGRTAISRCGSDPPTEVMYEVLRLLRNSPQRLDSDWHGTDRKVNVKYTCPIEINFRMFHQNIQILVPCSLGHTGLAVWYLANNY